MQHCSKIGVGVVVNFKMADSKKLSFLKSPILKKNLWKFYRSVLGLVGLIDAKDSDVA